MMQPLMQMAANDIQERKTLRTQNKSIEYLRSVNPELAKMAENNPAMVGNIMSAYASQQMKGSGELMTHTQLQELFPNSSIPEGMYNVTKKDGKVIDAKKVGGGGQTFNLGGNDISEFMKASQKSIAAEFQDLSKGAINARQVLAQTQVLEQLLNDAGTGFETGLKQFIKNSFGIDIRGDAAAAANALISQLVPGQRAPGSGTMSDADLLLYKNSLPSITNKPGGNQIIIESMKGIAQYQLNMGIIAQKALTNPETYTPEMAYADMQNLPNPLQNALNFIKTNNITQSSSSSTSSTMTWNPDLNGGQGGFE
jgi:hypothetical protein